MRKYVSSTTVPSQRIAKAAGKLNLQRTRKTLAKLPILAFEVKYLKLDKEHCVMLTEDCGHRYSVPASHVAKRVSVLKTSESLFIYDIETSVCIGKHKRFLEASGQKTHILPEHLTAKGKHQRLSKDEWAQELIGSGYTESTAVNVVEIKWKSDPMNVRRFCSCLRRLAKKNRSGSPMMPSALRSNKTS